MINALQLIVHVPLFSLKFPANAQYMYSMLQSLSNFDIIPEQITDKIKKAIKLNAINSHFEQLDIF